MALQGEEDMYCFLSEGIEVLKNTGEVFISEALKKIQIISKVTVQVGVSLSGNLLHMELGSEQFSKEQLAEILSRYEKKKKYYRLKSGEFIRMEFREAGDDKRRALIVTPASLVYNWKSEFEKFAPELMVHTVAGTVKEREHILSGLEEQAVIITSYQLLYRDEELYEKIFFDYQIIDEAQFIKNQGNQTAKAVKAVDARFRMALTGTPIEIS